MLLVGEEERGGNGTELVWLEVEHGEHVGVDESFVGVVEGENRIAWS